MKSPPSTPPADHGRPLRVDTASIQGLGARLIRGFSWSLIATAFTQGGTFVVNLLLANLWGLELFGRYAIVQSTLASLIALAQPTTGATAIKYTAELRTRDPARAGRILGLCSIVSIVIALASGGGLLLTASGVATHVLRDPALTTALMIAGAIVFLTVLSGFLSGALAGLESYPALGKAGILTGTAYVTLCSLGGWRWGLVGALSGFASSACLQSVVLAFALRTEASRHGIRIAPREGARELSVFFRYVAPSACNSLVAFPAVWLSQAFLVRQDQGFQQMAIFAAANSFRILVIFLPTVLGQVSVSLLNNQRGAENQGRYRKLFWANLGATAGLSLLGSAGIVLAGPWLLGSFGAEFQTGSTVLAILMLSTLPETLSTGILQLVQSRERVWLSFAATVAPSYGTLALLAWLLTPQHGAEGLAWSYLIAMSVSVLGSLYAVRRVGLWDDSTT